MFAGVANGDHRNELAGDLREPERVREGVASHDLAAVGLAVARRCDGR